MQTEIGLEKTKYLRLKIEINCSSNCHTYQCHNCTKGQQSFEIRDCYLAKKYSSGGDLKHQGKSIKTKEKNLRKSDSRNRKRKQKYRGKVNKKQRIRWEEAFNLSGQLGWEPWPYHLPAFWPWTNYITIWASLQVFSVTQSYLTPCHPLGCSLPGSSVNGNSLGKNTRVGCHALLQGIFLTQGWNKGRLHRRWIPYSLSHQGSPWASFCVC